MKAALFKKGYDDGADADGDRKRCAKSQCCVTPDITTKRTYALGLQLFVSQPSPRWPDEEEVTPLTRLWMVPAYARYSRSQMDEPEEAVAPMKKKWVGSSSSWSIEQQLIRQEPEHSSRRCVLCAVLPCKPIKSRCSLFCVCWCVWTTGSPSVGQPKQQQQAQVLPDEDAEVRPISPIKERYEGWLWMCVLRPALISCSNGVFRSGSQGLG
jgi:hypothetical protein